MNQSYYDPKNLQKIPELVKLAPEAATSFFEFENNVYYASDLIPPKTKELIAIAVAHITGCPYCIDVHVKKGKSLGATKEEIFGAVLIAASTRAGAVLSHATHALNAYDEEQRASGETAAPSSSASASPPDCFC
ncbi:carboxymuconolactone decarboxylase family protein [Paenibacillus sp. NEAU-GSW1]|uniref:carboxymuconolactone decarboxylase family protein n=1 Tax=Paenibacillus sp. NEAU-GSW1 TaxID=2682486 RepID=UPI0012E23AC0|nr:carboxymuconolactone decarboxylase family protein [Paenibacillus sp. NEAU-GSW1]MUT64813.1 carboxymuconolactone decarboxylase family protein [Paenibacillus sp. NEAU-GSW1]